MSSSSQSTLAKECSELEKKLALEKDKVSLVEDQCDILKHEKEEMKQKVGPRTSYYLIIRYCNVGKS
jgi:hypothetical protein